MTIELKWVERLSLVGIVFLAALFVSIFAFSETAREVSFALLEWFEARGSQGMLLYIGLYSLMVLFLVPAVIFTLGAGFVFGFWGGILVVLISMAISAPTAFLMARYLFGERVGTKLKNHPRLKILNKGLRREGWKIVLLSRLVPGFPFKLSNYFFGLTEIPLRGFFLGSMLGMLPLTMVNVYAGSLAGRFTELIDREPEPFEWTLYAVGFVAMVLIVYYLIRWSREAMRRAVAEENGELQETR